MSDCVHVQLPCFGNRTARRSMAKSWNAIAGIGSEMSRELHLQHIHLGCHIKMTSTCRQALCSTVCLIFPSLSRSALPYSATLWVRPTWYTL